jgi:hypothetical protein
MRRAQASPLEQNLGRRIGTLERRRREVERNEIVRVVVMEAKVEVVELGDLQGTSDERQLPGAGLGPLVAVGVEAVGAKGTKETMVLPSGSSVWDRMARFCSPLFK